MARTFLYCRVSTSDQSTDNQVREVEGAGFRADSDQSASYPALAK